MQGHDDPLGWALSLLRARPSMDPEKLAVLERMASHRLAGTSQPSSRVKPDEARWSRQLQAQRRAMLLLSRNLPLPPAVLDAIGSGSRVQETFRNTEARVLFSASSRLCSHIIGTRLCGVVSADGFLEMVSGDAHARLTTARSGCPEFVLHMPEPFPA